MRSAAGNEQVFLIKPAADITVERGDWLALNADQGIYDRDSKTLALSGAVSLYADNGFEMHTDQAEVDLNSGVIQGTSAVRGQGPWGLLNANGFKYAHKGDIMHNSEAPIEITADSMEWLNAERIAIARGNADAVQGNYTLSAHVLTAHMAETSPEDSSAPSRIRRTS